MTDTGSVTLRRLQRGDDAFVRALSLKEFGEYAWDAGARTLRMAMRSSSVAFVAVFAENPLGFAVLDFGPTQGNLDAIAVAVAHRGKGIGRLLLARVEAEARRVRRHELRLVTAEANVAALDLFLRSGFQIVERCRRYYPKGQNAVVMTKTLR